MGKAVGRKAGGWPGTRTGGPTKRDNLSVTESYLSCRLVGGRRIRVGRLSSLSDAFFPGLHLFIRAMLAVHSGLSNFSLAGPGPTKCVQKKSWHGQSESHADSFV